MPALNALETLLFSQHARLLTLATPLADARFLVERFSGREAVSESFRFEIDCLSTDAAFDIDRLLGEEISLGLLLAEGGHRVWHGFVTEAMHLGADGGFARYRFILESSLAFLALRRDWYLFQDMTALEAVARVFADHPQIAWQSEVTQTLAKRAILTQAGESDADFVARLLAAEGLSFRFVHEQHLPANGEQPVQARHRLIIFDREAEWPLCAQPEIRFHRRDATEQSDTLFSWRETRSSPENAVAFAAWDSRQLRALAAQARSSVDNGELPLLEIHQAAWHGRFESAEAAQRMTDLALAAAESEVRRFAGEGAVRKLAAGTRFTLSEHAGFVAEAAHFAVLAVEHRGANNLEAAAAEILGQADVEAGTYAQRLIAQPADAPCVPRLRDKPRSRSQSALVVGYQAPLATERDHRVKIQFPWQRGSAPNRGGMAAEGSGKPGNAPGNGDSGTWVRVAEWLSGPDWGSHFLPRVGQEVLVDFVAGDIDQPIIVGQFYNGADLPPFSAGQDSAANHPGVIAGWMSHNFERGYNQWLVDDAPGQLRTRLSTSENASELALGHLIHQPAASSTRGAWRGSGFEWRTDGWLAVRAGEGILISATARNGAVGTQLEAPEALAQLKAAEATATALGDAAAAQGAQALNREPHRSLIPDLDPAQLGKHPPTVNGQTASTPDQQAVPRFAQPYLLAEAPADIALTTPASTLLFAGGHLHATAQGDLHTAATRSIASSLGQTVSLFTHQGGIKNIAQAGSNTLEAHTGPLEVLADQSLTITSTNDEIRLFAKDKILLQAGQSSIALDGPNITFTCPGTFSVKGATSAFLGPASGKAELEALPDSQIDKDPNWIEIKHQDANAQAFAGQPYKIHFADGSIKRGTLDANGFARHEGVPEKADFVEYAAREPLPEKAWQPLAQMINAARQKLG